MTPLEINRIVTRLLSYRDGLSERCDRDLIADACNALDGYAKQTRAIDALVGEHDVVDIGPANEHPSQGPNWAMQATTFLREQCIAKAGGTQ